nr:TIGR00303 family protein [Scytonema millei]
MAIRIYTQLKQGQAWIERYRGGSPAFACVLGFTATGLIPGISAAGLTPEDRQYTAIADAEFLASGPQPQPQNALPPLPAGASPVAISRAVVEELNIPLYLFNAGLPQPPTVPTINLGGTPAKCLSQGDALPLATVKHLLEQGLVWGERLGKSSHDYLIIGECVVGGTTTALAILTGLGVDAVGKVNSSHPICNHTQKWELVQAGLQRAGLWEQIPVADPAILVAAVGDPMQIVVAGIAIAASRTKGVILAGGTQMLAVYALMQSVVKAYHINWHPEAVVVGTTRWVAEDPTGKTVELAASIDTVTLLSTELSFATSRYTQLRAYEQGYVKEGMGAGGCAIASSLTAGWNQTQLLQAIEALMARMNYNIG